MSPSIALVFLIIVTLQAFAQENSLEPQKECKFLDGKSVSVAIYDDAGRVARLATNDRLVTIKGINVPSGDYTISPVEGSGKKWTLVMKRDAGNRDLPPIPMAARACASPIPHSTVSLRRTGASCTMNWELKESNVVLSVEFAERNTDMPLLPRDLGGGPIK